MQPDVLIRDVIMITPAIALFLMSLFPLLHKLFRGNLEPHSLVTSTYGLCGVIISAAFMTVSGYRGTAFADAVVFDGFSLVGGLTILAVAAVAIIYSRENLATNNGHYSEFMFLLLNSAAGMLLVGWANDFITLFVGIEVMSLCLYIMIALSTEERLSKEAAFKYFVLGSFASAILLYGIAFVFGTAGGVGFAQIAEKASDLVASNRLFLVGLGLVAVGLFFKVSIFPFHSWTPDVYQGASTPVTFFMASGVKVATFIAILRFVKTGVFGFEDSSVLVNVLQWLAALTMVAGNVLAVMQNNLKRMLAYSSIAHSGYTLMGVVVAAVSLDDTSVFAVVLFYVVSYALMTAGSFGIVSLLERDENSALTVDDLAGLGRRRPAVAACTALFLLSLAGIPPTLGFFSKLMIFAVAVKAGFYWLAVWGAIGSMISVYYYLRPIVAIYMREPGENRLAELGRDASIVLVGIGGLLIVVLGVFSSGFYELVARVL